MSSISAQGVVERASAELSKRINGLGLRSNKHHRGDSPQKTSVMERVTNVFCGGGSASISAPEKPSRLLPARSATRPSSNGNAQSQQIPVQTRAKVQLQYHTQQLCTWDQLMVDERFLSRFFLYFTASERRVLAQVCSRWRDILYRSPRYWTGLVPVLQCRELRTCSPSERARLYSSLLRRGFHAVCLLGASDEDALDLVHSFPLASKQVHSLSLRCSSVSDRGLEALLDHLQVNFSLFPKHTNSPNESHTIKTLTPSTFFLATIQILHILININEYFLHQH